MNERHVDEAPARLRIEHGPRLLGVGAPRPRLSWWLPPSASAQIAYRLAARVNGVEQEVVQVTSPASILRPWPFRVLHSRDRVAWRVQAETDAGWTPWSEPGMFEMGLLEATEWRARFVAGPQDHELRPRGDRPAVYLRRTFRLDHPATRARLYATAQGIYEVHLDGVRIGDLELTPGFTAYRSHLEVQTYDVTGLLGAGAHTLVATLSDGWWRGSTGFHRVDRVYGDHLAFLGQLEVETETGDRVVVVTDEAWEASENGPIRAADLMEGERVDLRVPFPPPSGWCPVTVTGSPDDGLAVSPAPPTRRIEELRPREVKRLDRTRQVVDLGANINGWARLAGRALGPAGTTVRLRHGERLGPDGDLDTSNLEAGDQWHDIHLGPGQLDEVTSGASGEPFEPRHTTHGFQFVGIEGAPDLTAVDVAGVVVHTDLERTGWFRCSDQRLNALHEATVLSFRDNACEVPTDCPHRERAGWTGDWQIFVATAAFLYDVAGFSDRWLRDLAADQWQDGRVPNFVPEPLPDGARAPGSVAEYLTGSAGWGDAAVIVPFQIWQSYGDLDLLHRQYPSMVRWVDFALGRASAHRHPSRMARRPEPAPHERYLWDVGFHWGEWCEPGGNPAPVFTGEADLGIVATAYLEHSLATLADVAGLLDRPGDDEHYRELAQSVRAAWQAEYVDDEGRVTPATQANLVRALAFGLVEDHQRERVAGDLVALVRQAGTHVGTGFLATPFLLPTLAETGHLDVAYELLLQTSPPAWLAMIESGATIWENWEGVTADGGSLNHYSKGAVISFLHEVVAGIRPVRGVPAYRRFEVRPRPGGGVRSAEALLHTPYGPIASTWEIGDDETLALSVTVAPSTEAQVVMPDGRSTRCGPGRHRLSGPAR